MILAAIGGFCFGALLARHFRALILLPVSLVAILLVTENLVGSSPSVASRLIEGLALAAALQTGYFFGLFRHAAPQPGKTELNTVWR